MSDAGELLLVLYEHIQAAAPVGLHHTAAVQQSCNALAFSEACCRRLRRLDMQCPTSSDPRPVFTTATHCTPHATLQAEAAAAAVDRAFGLHIAEAVRCQQCGRVTQEGRYTQVGHCDTAWRVQCHFRCFNAIFNASYAEVWLCGSTRRKGSWFFPYQITHIQSA